jgi:hypothetical protein
VAANTLILLQLGAFIATINNIMKYLKQPILSTPSGNHLVQKELGANSKTNLAKYIEDYVATIMV